MRWRIRRLLRLIVVMLLAVLVLFFILRSKYRLVIEDLAQTQVKNTTSDLTNDAIAKQIASGDIRYDRIVFFEKDLDGRITALKTNMSEVNRLKTDILNIINDEILALDTSDIGIPLGSLFLPELLAVFLEKEEEEEKTPKPQKKPERKKKPKAERKANPEKAPRKRRRARWTVLIRQWTTFCPVRARLRSFRPQWMLVRS